MLLSKKVRRMFPRKGLVDILNMRKRKPIF